MNLRHSLFLQVFPSPYTHTAADQLRLAYAILRDISIFLIAYRGGRQAVDENFKPRDAWLSKSLNILSF